MQMVHEDADGLTKKNKSFIGWTRVTRYEKKTTADYYAATDIRGFVR